MMDIIVKVTKNFSNSVQELIDRSKKANGLSLGLRDHKIVRRTVMTVLGEQAKMIPYVKLNPIRNQAHRSNMVFFEAELKGGTINGYIKK